MSLLLRRRALLSKLKKFLRTVSGAPPVICEACTEDPVENYKIDGNSIQNGTPTPDTPVEVESVGEYDEATGKYKIPVVASGKNLFDTRKKSYSQGLNYTYLNNNSCEIITTGNTPSRNVDFAPFTVRKQTVYNFNVVINSSGDTNNLSHNRLYVWGRTGTSGSYTLITATGNLLGNLTNRLIKCSFNTKDYTQIKLSYYVVTGGATDLVGYTATLTNMQLELGKTATDFEPYQEPIVTNIYLPEPLRKVGEYADYVDFENQKVVRNIFEEVLDGSKTVEKYNHGACPLGFYLGYGINKEAKYLGIETLLSSNFKTVNNTVSYFEEGTITLSTTKIRVVFVITENETTTEQVTAWLQNNKPIVCYVLETPTEELIDLPQLPTLKGTTVYTINTELLPSNMEVTYYSKESE